MAKLKTFKSEWEFGEISIHHCRLFGFLVLEDFSIGVRDDIFLIYFNFILFIWLHWVLVAAQDLLSSLQHVGSSSPTRDQTWAPLCWELGVLATGPPGKSSDVIIYQIIFDTV